MDIQWKGASCRRIAIAAIYATGALKIDATQSPPLESIQFLKVSDLMPLYEYQCKKCGHRFEKIRKFSDKPIKKCPECGGAVEQMISAPAVQFKGSGWYVTDYARKSGAPASSEGGKDSKDSKETKKEEKKTESNAKESTAKKADKQK
jgi:putative FmdB family regulatory protein